MYKNFLSGLGKAGVASSSLKAVDADIYRDVDDREFNDIDAHWTREEDVGNLTVT